MNSAVPIKSAASDTIRPRPLWKDFSRERIGVRAIFRARGMPGKETVSGVIVHCAGAGKAWLNSGLGLSPACAGPQMNISIKSLQDIQAKSACFRREKVGLNPDFAIGQSGRCQA